MHFTTSLRTVTCVSIRGKGCKLW